MLGRLKMTVDQCINEYLRLFDRVFKSWKPLIGCTGKVRGKFDSNVLERAIKEVVGRYAHSEDALLRDDENGRCKVYNRLLAAGLCFRD
jgi:hypothetical protein